MRRAAVAIFAACLLFNPAAAHAAATSTETLKLGVLLPPDPLEAEALRSGVERGLRICRTSGTAVEWVARSRSGQWGVDGEEAAQLALADDACGLISPPSGASTHLVLQVAGRTAIPVVSLCSDSSVSGAGIPWMRQVVPETRLEAETLLRHVATNFPPHATNWLAVVPSGRQGREILRDLREAASHTRSRIPFGFELREDGTMAEFRDPGSGSTNRASKPTTASASRPQPAATGPLLKTLQAAKPDGVLIWIADARAAGILESIVASGYRGPIGGTARLLNPSFRSRAGTHASRLLLAVPAALASPSTMEVAPPRAHATTEQASSPELDWLQSMACDATLTLVELCKRAEDPGEMAAGAAAAHIGVTGPLRFSPDGRRQLDLTVILADLQRPSARGSTLPGR
jgi:ABC-type branched-subunit amino acid transport system substrate-binding protein